MISLLQFSIEGVASCCIFWRWSSGFYFTCFVILLRQSYLVYHNLGADHKVSSLALSSLSLSPNNACTKNYPSVHLAVSLSICLYTWTDILSIVRSSAIKSYLWVFSMSIVMIAIQSKCLNVTWRRTVDRPEMVTTCLSAYQSAWPCLAVSRIHSIQIYHNIHSRDTFMDSFLYLEI